MRGGKGPAAFLGEVGNNQNRSASSGAQPASPLAAAAPQMAVARYDPALGLLWQPAWLSRSSSSNTDKANNFYLAFTSYRLASREIFPFCFLSLPRLGEWAEAINGAAVLGGAG